MAARTAAAPLSCRWKANTRRPFLAIVALVNDAGAAVAVVVRSAARLLAVRRLPALEVVVERFLAVAVFVPRPDVDGLFTSRLP
jgi:hypothetical protein